MVGKHFVTQIRPKLHPMKTTHRINATGGESYISHLMSKCTGPSEMSITKICTKDSNFTAGKRKTFILYHYSLRKWWVLTTVLFCRMEKKHLTRASSVLMGKKQQQKNKSPVSGQRYCLTTEVILKCDATILYFHLPFFFVYTKMYNSQKG